MTQQTCYATKKCHDIASIPHHPHVSSIKQLVHELCLLQDFVHHLPGRFFLHTGFSFPFFWHCKTERNHKKPHTNASFRLEHILQWWNTLSAPLRQNMLDTFWNPPNKHELQHVKTSCFGSVLMPFSLDRYFCDLKFCSLGANQLKICDHHGQQLHAQNTISNKKTQIQTIPGKLTWNLNKGKSSSRVYINSLAPRKRSSSPLDRLLLHIILRCIQSILR